MNKKNLKIILNLILIFCIIFASYKIYKEFIQYHTGKKIYNTIRNENQIEPKKISSYNTDFKFWLNVQNTNINYPVVQSSNNDFYLNHDFLRKKDKLGCLFVDSKCNLDNCKNIIIYGHNMLNDTMFSELQKFKEEYFFYGNNNIVITKNNKNYIYQPFSVYIVNGNYDKLQINFKSDSNYLDYLKYIKGKSIYNLDINLTSKDKIVTLVSCDYTKKNDRIIIQGRLVP